jgi:AraC family transcriptional regulator of adaptative response/methylated-DNA-[protein]-cysteine methyltransferase
MIQNKFYISEATLADIEPMVYLLGILFEQEHEFVAHQQKQKEALSLILGNKSLGKIFVIKEQEKTVGMVNILFTISTALGGKAAILEDMIIHPDYRSKGMASHLLAYVLDWLQSNQFKRVSLLTDADNIMAQALYRKHGFEQSSMCIYRKIIG